MKNLFKKIFLNVFLLPFFSFATVTTKLGDKIKVDGIIESKEWEGAQIFDLKYEYDPGYNTLPPFKTTAYVTYSDTKLYVAFDAKIEDIKYLRASIRERDTGFMDDWVAIALDTYGDNRSLIIIGSNAYGSQLDFKIGVGDNNGDPSFNINYESKGVIGEDGYVVEMFIPFSELQYEKKDTLRWKASFLRTSWKENRIAVTNNKIDRGNDCIACQIETYIELEGVNPKKRLEFLPYVSGNYVGSSDGNKISYDKPSFKAGLSARYDLSSSTALDFTINPDFSQVEADVTRININSPFAVNYPERRPFFNEGNDILSSYGDAVYTRSINNPIFASKLVNQGSKQRVYFLTSYDRDTPYLVPGENRSYFGKGEGSFGNILRYQRTFENGSNVGFLSTNRFYNGGMGNMFGLDAKIRFNKTYNLDFVYGNSFSEEPNKDWISSSDVIEGKTVALDGERFSGNALSIGFNRISEHWATSIEYDQLSPLFRADMGFVTQNNFREFSFEQGYINQRDNKVQLYFGKIEAELRYNYEGKLKRVHLLPVYSMKFKNGFSFDYAYSYNVFEEYNGDEFKNFASNYVGFRYAPNEKFSVFSRNLIGKTIAYNLSYPEVGKRIRLNLSINYRPNEKLSFSPSISSESMKYIESNEKIYSGYIFRLNSKYQFSNDLSFKIVSEYNNFTSSLFMQPLLKWNPNPSTIFYIGGNTHINHLKDNDDRWATDNSQLFLKLQYLFKIN